MKPFAELANFLPYLAIIAAVFGFIGWSLHKLMARPATEKSSSAKPTATAEKGRLERVKNLEASLEKSKAAQKSLKTELEELQGKSVPVADFESTVAELDATRKSLETESKRFSTLETDLKKSQETIKHLNARANEADKTQKDRSFALENELSKVREQLAVFQNTPDDTKNLQTEIERLRESVAVSSRYAGEMRKREAAALEALEKAEAKLAELSDPSRPAAASSKKVGPVVDSGRIAAAKAEVIRLVEMNKQKETVVGTDLVEEVPAVIIEDSPAAIEEVAVLADEAPVAKKAAPATELFALD
jgi:DNA repair exonuclease SbcCD ATPase subunit